MIIEDATHAHQRPKLDIYDDVLFIVLRTAQLIGGEVQYGETRLIVGKGFVVSVRHGASASYAAVRQRCEKNPELLRLGESAIMYAILDFVGDNYFPDPVFDQERNHQPFCAGKSAIAAKVAAIIAKPTIWIDLRPNRSIIAAAIR